MNANKLSYFAVLLLAFLLPIFFLPTILPLGMAKAALIALLGIIGLVALVWQVLGDGGLKVPAISALGSGIILALAYLASAFSSVERAKSFFGAGFEVGTFGSILLGVLLLALGAMAFKNSAQHLKALTAIFLSLAILASYSLVQIVRGESVVANPVGFWTDLGTAFGLLAMLSALALSVLPLNKILKVAVSLVLVLSIVLLAAVNFSTAWVLTLGASLAVLAWTYSAHKAERMRLVPSIVLLVVSLLFVINPVVSPTEGSLGNVTANMFGVSNAIVRPTLSTTLGVAKQSLGQDLWLGTGPNTFEADWLLYKPQAVNTTQFWNASFPYGFGFLPTQLASVGTVGTAAWVLFLVLFLIAGIRTLYRTREFGAIATLAVSLYLWVASFFYVPSTAMFTLAFMSTGLFIAAAALAGSVKVYDLSFAKRPLLNFASVVVLVVVGLGGLSLGLTAFQKVASAMHYERALVLSGTDGASADTIELELAKAIRLSPQDYHYGAFSQISLARAQSALNATEGSQEDNQKRFQAALESSIAGAQSAINMSPTNYRNWSSLGSIYASLAAKPFSLAGAYDAAKNAYAEALRRNPTSPEIPLQLARLEFSLGNVAVARTHIDESLKQKRDYAEAYFLLTQIEIAENNTAKAIESAEVVALLSQDNAGVFFQLGLLKYSNSDWRGAAAAFDHAITLVPNYANAKYYLGLAQAKLDNKDRALELFRDLKRDNPDNQEVTTILANLESGKDALAGMEAPAQVKGREELPI